MDDLYPQPTTGGGGAPTRAAACRAASYELADNDLSAYRWIADRWRSWDEVREASLRIAAQLERARSLDFGEARGTTRTSANPDGLEALVAANTNAHVRLHH